MTNISAWSTALAVLTSLGGGGIIVAALSSWLGKIWAARLMANETAMHSRDLEALRSELHDKNEKSSHLFKEKIALYKEASKPLIELITEIQMNGGPNKEAWVSFEKSRLSSAALLALFAPAEVFVGYNEIIDYLFDCTEQKKEFEFSTFRSMALKMLSRMRKDVGLYEDNVEYTGSR